MNSAERILIIEDDMEQAEPFKEMLEYRGYEVESTDNVNDALTIASSSDPHLAVVDLLLVNTTDSLDGYDAIAALRDKLGVDLGILVWTSHFVNPRDEIRALRAGADDYIRKDAEFGLIEARIEALIRRVVRARYLRSQSQSST